MSAYRFFKLGSPVDLASSSNSAALARYSATLRMGPPRNQRPPSNAVCSHLTVENRIKLIEEGGTMQTNPLNASAVEWQTDVNPYRRPRRSYGDAFAKGQRCELCFDRRTIET